MVSINEIDGFVERYLNFGSSGLTALTGVLNGIFWRVVDQVPSLQVMAARCSEGPWELRQVTTSLHAVVAMWWRYTPALAVGLFSAVRSVLSTLKPLEEGVHWIDSATKAAFFALMPTFLENTGIIPANAGGELVAQLFYGVALLASSETLRRMGSKTAAVVTHLGAAVWGMVNVAFFLERSYACVPIATTYSELFGAVAILGLVSFTGSAVVAGLRYFNQEGASCE